MGSIVYIIEDNISLFFNIHNFNFRTCTFSCTLIICYVLSLICIIILNVKYTWSNHMLCKIIQYVPFLTLFLSYVNVCLMIFTRTLNAVKPVLKTTSK